MDFTNFYGVFRRLIFILGITFISTLTFGAERSTEMADPHSKFESAEVCAGCHATQYKQWRSSMMGYSSISPPIHALELTENHVNRGAFGRLSRTDNAPKNQLHQETQLFCQKCHSPVAVFTDLFSNVDDFNYTESNRGMFPDSHSLLRQIAGVDSPDNVTDTITASEKQNAFTAMEGVTCTVCHSIRNMESDTSVPFRLSGEEGVANSAYTIEHYADTIDFTENYSSKTFLGPNKGNPPHGKTIGRNGASITGTDGESRPFIQSSEFCGTCHDVRIPQEDAISGEPFQRVENLFTEWKESPWNNGNDNLVSPLQNPGDVLADGRKEVTTCQDCHMSNFMLDKNAKPGEYPMGKISNGSNDTEISNHRFIGVDRFLLHANIYDINGNIKPTTLADYDISEINQNNLSNFDDILQSSLLFDDGKADAREILLEKAVDFKIVSAEVENDTLTVKVSAENVGAGHNIPAGLSQERQVWIELEVINGQGENVYTSGYLNHLATESDHFDPYGPKRYQDSYCGLHDGTLEYKCDLDAFHAELDDAFRIQNNSLADGPDANLRKKTGLDKKNLGLINYQNEFSENGEKVFTQFIADAINNNNALKPFEPQVHQYDIAVDPADGPFIVNARLRFRPLPHEFLETLSNINSARVTEDVIAKNKVIEMEQDSCAVGNTRHNQIRACNDISLISVSFNSTCILNQLGVVQCFGNGQSGVLGDGNLDNHTETSPVTVKNLGNDVISLVSGLYHHCALLNDGTVKCWGSGGLGNNSTDSSALPVFVIDSQTGEELKQIVALDAGRYHTCALMEDTTLKCWGSGRDGKLGLAINDFTDKLAANHVQDLETGSILTGVIDVSVNDTGCAVLKSGIVKCWGPGHYGKLGDGDLSNHDSDGAITVQGLDYKAKKVAAGYNHNCALLETGKVACWGDGAGGVLGTGAAQDIAFPEIANELENVVDIEANTSKTCAILNDGSVKCLGRLYGQGSSTFSFSPVEIDFPSKVKSISLGLTHICGTTVENKYWCWGNSRYGKLGNSDVENNIYSKLHNVRFAQILFDDAEGESTLLNKVTAQKWSRTSGGTPSYYTGPTSGYGGSGNYYFVETSSGYAAFRKDISVSLETNEINSDDYNGLGISFKFHMYGAGHATDPSNIGTLFVEVFYENQWHPAFNIEGDQGDDWKEASWGMATSGIDGKIKFRIRVLSAGGWRGDIAIDNILIEGY